VQTQLRPSNQPPGGLFPSPTLGYALRSGQEVLCPVMRAPMVLLGRRGHAHSWSGWSEGRALPFELHNAAGGPAVWREPLRRAPRGSARAPLNRRPTFSADL